MTLENTKHYPVMLNQVLSIITPQHGGTFIDCTFGGGSYSEAILKYPNTKVIAFDRDTYVKKYADILKKNFPKRFNFFQDKFSNLVNNINEETKPDGIIFDLGISNFQIKDSNRGFSFKSSASLNMEMGINKITVNDAINKLDKNDLARIIKVFGDEKDGKKIANKIAQKRKIKRIETTEELVKIIKLQKKKFSSHKINFATKTFQALRIFVNKELSELIFGLIAATKILKENGKIVVVNFHSLEDRITKNFFKIYSNERTNPSRYFPKIKEKDDNDLFFLKEKKFLVPSSNEVQENPKSRSAKLRYAIRTKNAYQNFNEIEKIFRKYLEIEGINV